jgi:hypothetical protein
MTDHELWKAAEEVVVGLTEERDKLQAFKNWVHAYLDGKGVPHHPPGTHGAAGCRIGDRMDWVWAERDRLRDRNAFLQGELEKVNELGRLWGFGQGELNDDIADCLRTVIDRLAAELAELRAACDPIRRCAKLSKEGTDSFILWDDLKPLAALLARTSETSR